MKINLPVIFNNGLKLVKSNAPEILAAASVTGVVTTSYLVGKASFQAADDISFLEYQAALSNAGKIEQIELSNRDRLKLVWKRYIPAGISGAATIVCIIASYKASGNRTAAAMAAYSLSEKAFSEYKEKVIEEIGEGKDRKIRDKIAEEKVLENPPNDKEVIIIGGLGHVLCCELFTHRYFRSDMETLRKAQNDINARIVNEMYVTINEFYDLIGLSNTTQGDWLGWNSDRLMELEFSTVMADTGEPCLAFDFNYTKTVI